MRTHKIHFDKIQTDIEFLIGENAEENTKLIFMADDEDLWFHISGGPSAHVIAVIHNVVIERKHMSSIAKHGALLCKQYTNRVKSSKDKIDIIYTKIKNVTPVNHQGTVDACNTKTISV